jgi:hypothetical protein
MSNVKWRKKGRGRSDRRRLRSPPTNPRLLYRSQRNLLKMFNVLYDVSDIIFTSMIYNSQSVRMFKSVSKIILAAGVALA